MTRHVLLITLCAFFCFSARAQSPPALYPPLHCLAGDEPPNKSRAVWIQFGVFDHLENAKTYAEVLGQRGIRVKVSLIAMEHLNEGEAYTVVSEETHASLKDARAECALLKQKNIDCDVREGIQFSF